MKIRIGNRVLRAAVEAVRSAAGSPLNNPVVANLWVKAEDGAVVVSATNLNIAIRYETRDCEVEEPGGILLDAATIAEVARDLPEGEVEFSADEKFSAKILCGKFKARIGGSDPDLFPPFPAVDQSMDHYEVFVDDKDLRRLLSRGLLALAPETESARYQTSGVQISVRDGALRMATTDGRRLSLCDDVGGKCKLVHLEDGPASVIAPGRALRDALRILPADCEIKMVVGLRKVEINAAEVTVVANLLNGNFPEIDRIVPPPGDLEANFEREPAAAAVHRVSALSDQETKMVRLVLGEAEKHMEIQGERESSGGEARDTVECDYGGKPLELRFNHKFLLDFLRGIDDAGVRMNWSEKENGQSGPVVFRGLKDGEHKYVLMPMRRAEE